MKNKLDFKEWLKKSLILSSVTVLVSLLICFTLKKVIPFIGVDGSGFLKAYYEWRNKARIPDLDQYDDLIVLITTDEYSGPDARARLADLIDSLSSAEPLAIGIDVIFPDRHDPNNDKLSNAIKRNANKIVLARFVDDNVIHKSFFDDDTYFSGIVNLPDYYSFPRYYKVGDKKYESFSYQLAKLAIPDGDCESDRFIVNYTSHTFNSIAAERIMSDSTHDRRQEVKDKIVLIGDYQDIRDIHTIPFKIQGKNWLSGINLHAYPLVSLCDDNVAFHKAPVWFDIVLCFVLTFLFSFLFTFVSLLGRTLSNMKSKFAYELYLIAKPFLIVFIETAILWLCFVLLTKPFNLVPSALVYMIAVLIINKISGYLSYLLTNNDE